MCHISPEELTRLKDDFWAAVKTFLVECHGLDDEYAIQETVALQKRLLQSDDKMRERYPDEKFIPLPSDAIYHDNPFYIACDLTGVEKTPDSFPQYREIMDRYGLM
jgi:hypothetical protein